MQRYRVVIMLVLFGVLPVVVAFFVALSFLEEQETEPPPVVEAPVVEEEPPPPPPPETRQVFAAARALPVGALLGKDDLTVIELEVTEIEDDHIEPGELGSKLSVDPDGPAKPQDLRGHAVRAPIAAQAPLTWSAVVGPGQKGFLAAVLRPGTRAVTIRVGAATGHAGLIDPGDQVDVILSAELSIDGGERIVFARTIAEDVRVVAIDRRVEILGEGASGSEGITTATLEATPPQADRLVLGEHEGRLSLTVRSLASVAAAQDPNRVEAVELREMLLSSSEFSASEARLRRVQELSDLATQQQLLESRAQLKAMVEAGATEQEQVRVFRGTAPAEVVVFERR